MAIRYTINTAENKATLEIYVAGVFETAYSYDNGIVTLSERPNPASLTPENYRNNLNDIQGWIGRIDSELHPAFVSRGLCSEDVDKKNTKVDAVFKLGNDFITKAELRFVDNTYDFDSRDEYSISFSDFKEWYLFLEKFYRAGL